MLRGWVMWAMFLSSYTPLFALVGIRSLGESGVIAIASGLLIVAGAAGTALVLRVAPSKNTESFRLVEVEQRDGDVAAYAATYLLPFLTVFSGDAKDIVSLVAFIAFLGFVYVRSRLIYVNPILLLMGYHLWRVIPITDGVAADTNTVRWPRYVLADASRMRQGQRIRAYSLTHDLLLYESDIEPGAAAQEHEGQEEQEQDAW